MIISKNICGIHQHLVKTVCIVSPSCSFNSDFAVFPGCLFHSFPVNSVPPYEGLHEDYCFQSANSITVEWY